jgi:hypothetical protein
MDWARILAYVTGLVDQLKPPFQVGLQDAIFRARIFADSCAITSRKRHERGARLRWFF